MKFEIFGKDMKPIIIQNGESEWIGGNAEMYSYSALSIKNLDKGDIIKIFKGAIIYI